MKCLKPCPFCGSSATVWRSLFGCIVECDNENCGCSYGNNMSLDADEVAELWNRREIKDDRRCKKSE